MQVIHARFGARSGASIPPPQEPDLLIFHEERLLVQALSRRIAMLGHPVRPVSDVQAAVARLASGWRPRLMILQVHPGQVCGGFELIEGRRRLPGQVERPFVCISRVRSAPLRERCLGLGAVTCLEPPFGVGELLACIETAAAGYPSAGNDR